jgi:hypothetical protein
MAVYKKAKPLVTTITLDDGQDVNVKLRRHGFNVGDKEQIEDMAAELPFVQKRIEKLSDAIDAAETQDEYEKALGQYKEFVKKRANLLPMVDTTIVMTVMQWDFCLTEEDEANGNPMAINLDSISQLDPTLRYDFFSKITEKLKGRSESEKKELPASLPEDSQTKTESPEASQPSTPVISSPENTANPQTV